MKKVLVGMFIALMGVFMVSCSNTGGIEKAKEILSELKANGANLDVEGLKAKLMEFAAAMKPEITKMNNLMEEMKKDPSKADDVKKELKSVKDNMIAIDSIFNEIAREVPAVDELLNNKEFFKKYQEASGFVDEKSVEKFVNNLSTLGLLDE